MTDDLTPFGMAGVAVSVLTLLAGAGFRRLSVALIVALVIAGLAAAGMFSLVLKAGLSLERGGGEWRGIASLGVAWLAMLAAFALCFFLTMVLLAVRWGIFR